MKKLSVVIVISLSLFACEQSTQSIENETQEESQNVNAGENDTLKLNDPNSLPVSDYTLIDWVDLMPKDDLDALLNPPKYLDEIIDGSDDDVLGTPSKNESDSIDDYLYQQALTSRKIQTKFNNQAIKIPTFIVPIEYNEQQKVTQFFMVPFFGACLHLPPPPPNQTIFVNYPQGIKLESIYEAYWVSGIIKTSIEENEIATAAYSIEMHDFEIYPQEQY